MAMKYSATMDDRIQPVARQSILFFFFRYFRGLFFMHHIDKIIGVFLLKSGGRHNKAIIIFIRRNQGPHKHAWLEFEVGVSQFYLDVLGPGPAFYNG